MARARNRLVCWWVLQERQRVLARVAGHLAQLVEDLTLLVLAHVPIPRRQRAHQVMPTGSLHLSDLTFGRINYEGAPRRSRMYPEGEIPSPPRPSQPAGIESCAVRGNEQGEA